MAWLDTNNLFTAINKRDEAVLESKLRKPKKTVEKEVKEERITRIPVHPDAQELFERYLAQEKSATNAEIAKGLFKGCTPERISAYGTWARKKLAKDGYIVDKESWSVDNKYTCIYKVRRD